MVKRKRSASFEDLVSDVLIYMFTYLETKELLQNIECLSKHCQNLLKLKMFWSETRIEFVNNLHPRFFDKYGFYIQNLCLKFVLIKAKPTENYFKPLVNLKHLNLYRATFVDLSYIEDYIDNAHQLEELILPKTSSVSGKVFSNHFFLKVSKLKLRLLHLCYNQYFFESDYAMFLGYLTTNKLKLYLEDVQFSNFPNLDTTFLCNFASSCKKLKHVNLDLCNLSSNSFNMFLDKIDNLETISAKFVEYNNKTMEILIKKENLETITMCHVNHSNWEYNYLPQMKKLKKITIISGATFNFDCLRNIKTLKTVSIFRTKINNMKGLYDYMIDNKNINFEVSRFSFPLLLENKIPSNVYLL